MLTGEIHAFGRTWRCKWTEDECLRHDPSSEKLPDAWFHIYGESYPGVAASDDSHDLGDARAYLIGDRVVLHSYDGNSIWEEVKP